MRRTIGGIVLGLVVVLGFANDTTAQNLIDRTVSPQAYGRAGVYTYEGNDDPLAPLNNPAYLGLLSEHNRYMGTMYTHPSRLGIWTPDVKISARALNIGFDHRTIQRYFKIKLPLSVGFGYQEAFLDMGKVVKVDENGRTIGETDAFDRSRGLGIGAAMHGTCWLFSVGLATRYYNYEGSSQSTDYWGNDFGAILQFDLARVVDPHRSLFPATQRRLQPLCVASVGYSALRVGGKYFYTDQTGASHWYPQNRTGRLFLNLTGGLSIYHPIADHLQIITAGMAIEGIDNLSTYRNSHYEYRNPIGNMHVFDDLILGHANNDIGKAKGFEFTIAELFSFRSGSAEEEWYIPYNTEGYGVQLNGMLKILCYNRDLNCSQTLQYLVKHVDIQYNWSVHRERERDNLYYGGQSVLDNVTFESIVLLWKP